MEPLLLEIRQLYNLDLVFIEKVSGGFLSDNYILTSTEENYFLKKHRHLDLVHVEGVILAEQFFAEGSIPVILPLSTTDKKYFFEHEGRYYSLYPFVQGRHIERGLLSENAAVSLGATLAKLHKLGKKSTLPVPELFNAWDKEKFVTVCAAVKAVIAQKQEPSEFDLLTLKGLELKKNCVLANTITLEQLSLLNDHLIHGDYFCNNVFFDTNDKVSHVFDFEKTQFAPPLYEAFRSMFVSFFSIPSEENLLQAKKYLDAYLKEYPQPIEVVRNSFTGAFLKQIHSIWIEEEHYLKNSTRTDSILSSQVLLNSYLVTSQEKIKEFLFN